MFVILMSAASSQCGVDKVSYSPLSVWGGDGCHNWRHWFGSGSCGKLTKAPFTAAVTTVQMSVHPWMESCTSLTIFWWIHFKFDTNIINHNCNMWLLTISFMHNHEDAIWPSLCPCTIINPILLMHDHDHASGWFDKICGHSECYCFHILTCFY